MKIKSTISISRTHGGRTEEKCISIQLMDETSRIRFFEGRMSLEDFASALTGLSHVEIDGEVMGLEYLGMEKVTESREVVCPLTIYDRDILGKWLRENAKEDGWTVDTYLGSKNSVDSHPKGKLLRYHVHKYVAPDEQCQPSGDVSATA